jgi:CDP-diglyceride synthetase
MVEDDKLTEVAKTDLKIRTVAGFIFGIVAALASIVFIIVSIVNKNTEFIIPLIIMVLVGLGVSASCGYFLFRKEKKETVEEKQE